LWSNTAKRRKKIKKYKFSKIRMKENVFGQKLCEMKNRSQLINKKRLFKMHLNLNQLW
jgi:hypothetical protein